MENLDLTKLSDEQREKVMAIVNETKELESQKPNISNILSTFRKQDTPESNKIREEYLAGIKNVKLSEEYEGIELDTKMGFEDELKLVGNRNTIQGSNIYEKRLKNRLSHDDIVTYKQLEVIHENGVPNFWGKVKNVIESRKVVDISDISDEIDPELLK